MVLRTRYNFLIWSKNAGDEIGKMKTFGVAVLLMNSRTSPGPKVAWPSGLRRWFKAPVSSEAWVRIPPLPRSFEATQAFDDLGSRLNLQQLRLEWGDELVREEGIAGQCCAAQLALFFWGIVAKESERHRAVFL